MQRGPDLAMARDLRFESTFLQRRVRCKLDFEDVVGADGPGAESCRISPQGGRAGGNPHAIRLCEEKARAAGDQVGIALAFAA